MRMACRPLSSASTAPGSSTASADKTARIWDVATFKEIAVLRGYEDNVPSAAFSPDGVSVVTASYAKTPRIWHVATAREIEVLRGHEDGVPSAVFSPDGTRIVTASWDKTARIWDVATATEIAVLRGHEGPVQSAAFSPDGTRIVTASADKTVRVWDTATASETAVLRGHEDCVQSAAFSPDGTRIVTASRDRTARIWDVVSSKEIAVLRGHGNFLSSAAFSPDGTRIVTASWDKTVRIWDVWRVRKRPPCCAATRVPCNPPPSAPTVLASSPRPWTRPHVFGISATAGEIAVLRGRGEFVLSAAFSPDGTRIVTTSINNTARIWDVHFAMMPANDMIDEVCLISRLRGLTMLTRDEMRLIGHADSAELIDVCAGVADGKIVDRVCRSRCLLNDWSDFRSWHKTDMAWQADDVRSSGQSRHRYWGPRGPFLTLSGNRPVDFQTPFGKAGKGVAPGIPAGRKRRTGPTP